MQFHLRMAAAAAAAAGNRLMSAWLREVFRGLAATRTGYPLGFGDMSTAEWYQRDTLAALRLGDPDALLASLEVHLAGLETHFLGRSLDRPPRPRG